jgi:hypothetical protein
MIGVRLRGRADGWTVSLFEADTRSFHFETGRLHIKYEMNEVAGDLTPVHLKCELFDVM